MLELWEFGHSRLRVQQTDELALGPLCRLAWQVDARRHDPCYVEWIERRHKQRHTMRPMAFYYSGAPLAGRNREIDSLVYLIRDGVADLVWRCRMGEKEKLVIDLIADLLTKRNPRPSFHRTPLFVIDVVRHLLSVPWCIKSILHDSDGKLLDIDWEAWFAWQREPYDALGLVHSMSDPCPEGVHLLTGPCNTDEATLALVRTERLWSEFYDDYIQALAHVDNWRMTDVPDLYTLFEWFVCALQGVGDSFAQGQGHIREWFRNLGEPLYTLMKRMESERYTDSSAQQGWNAARGHCDLQCRALAYLFKERHGLPVPKREFCTKTRVFVAAEMEPDAADAYLRIMHLPWTLHQLGSRRQPGDDHRRTVLFFYDATLFDFQFQSALGVMNSTVLSFYASQDLAKRPYNDVCILVEMSERDADGWFLHHHVAETQRLESKVSAAWILYAVTSGLTEWVPAVWSALAQRPWLEAARDLAVSRLMGTSGCPLALADLARLSCPGTEPDSDATQACLYEAVRCYLLLSDTGCHVCRATLEQAEELCLGHKYMVIRRDLQSVLRSSSGSQSEPVKTEIEPVVKIETDTDDKNSGKRKAEDDNEDDAPVVRKRIRRSKSIVPIACDDAMKLLGHVKTSLEQGDYLLARLIFASFRCGETLPKDRYRFQVDETAVPSHRALARDNEDAKRSSADVIRGFLADLTQVLRLEPKWIALSIADEGRSWDDAKENRRYMLDHEAFSRRSVEVETIDATRVPDQGQEAIEWYLSHRGREWIRRSVSFARYIKEPHKLSESTVAALIQSCFKAKQADSEAKSTNSEAKPADEATQSPIINRRAPLVDMDQSQNEWPPIRRGRDPSRSAPEPDVSESSDSKKAERVSVFKAQPSEPTTEMESVCSAVATMLCSTPTLQRAAHRAVDALSKKKEPSVSPAAEPRPPSAAAKSTAVVESTSAQRRRSKSPKRNSGSPKERSRDKSPARRKSRSKSPRDKCKSPKTTTKARRSRSKSPKGSAAKPRSKSPKDARARSKSPKARRSRSPERTLPRRPPDSPRRDSRPKRR